jgi:hypothetical protein
MSLRERMAHLYSLATGSHFVISHISQHNVGDILIRLHTDGSTNSFI